MQPSAARLIPGLRVNTSIVACVAGISRRDFIAGVVAAALVWVTFWTGVGATVGLPAERYLGEFERLAFRGALLLVARRARADGGQ